MKPTAEKWAVVKPVRVFEEMVVSTHRTETAAQKKCDALKNDSAKIVRVDSGYYELIDLPWGLSIRPRSK